MSGRGRKLLGDTGSDTIAEGDPGRVDVAADEIVREFREHEHWTTSVHDVAL